MITSMETLRERIVKDLRIAIIIVGSTLFLITFWRDLIEGNWANLIIYSMITVVGFTVLFLPHFPVKTKSTILVSLVFLVGLTSTSLAGPFGVGDVWLISSCTLAAALLGRKAAIIYIGLAIVCVLAIIGFQMSSGTAWGHNVVLDIGFLTEWVFNIAILMLIGVIPVANLVENSEHSLSDARETSEDLSRLNLRLEESNKSLRTLNDTVANSLGKPLMRLQATIEPLADTHAKAKDSESVEQAMQYIRHIGRIIVGAQHISSVNPQSMLYSQVELKALINSCIQSLPIADTGMLRVTIERDEMISADQQLLRLLFELMFLGLVFHAEGKAVNCSIITSQQKQQHLILIETDLPWQQSEDTDDYLPLYSPFLNKSSPITGTDILLAQQIAQLHGGSIELQPGENDTLEIIISISSLGADRSRE